MTESQQEAFHCPIPKETSEKISLSHGGGGRMMNRLIQQYIEPLYQQPGFCHQDSAVLNLDTARIAFTSDSYVVHPIFFPGGDIGKLAVCGTINDLAMAGAVPRFLSLAFILEEGFPLASFEKILSSIQKTAHECQVEIVTGDTKVVDKNKADGIYINTTGLGYVPTGVNLGPSSIQAGDAILLSGDLGRHGVAVMSSRDATEAEVAIESDCAPLDQPIQKLLTNNIDIHCLRDLTRGGLASALNELAKEAQMSVLLEDSKIPVHPRVAAYCEILGIEPYYLANEGRFICILPSSQVTQALECLEGGTLIGYVEAGDPGWVRLRTEWGTERILPMLLGEPLPRIC